MRWRRQIQGKRLKLSLWFFPSLIGQFTFTTAASWSYHYHHHHPVHSKEPVTVLPSVQSLPSLARVSAISSEFYACPKFMQMGCYQPLHHGAEPYPPASLNMEGTKNLTRAQVPPEPPTPFTAAFKKPISTIKMLSRFCHPWATYLLSTISPPPLLLLLCFSRDISSILFSVGIL